MASELGIKSSMEYELEQTSVNLSKKVKPSVGFIFITNKYIMAISEGRNALNTVILITLAVIFTNKLLVFTKLNRLQTKVWPKKFKYRKIL